MHVSTRIVVIGVGNEYRHDDGVGWAVVSRLRERARRRALPSGIALTTCDGNPARLIDIWEHAHFCIVVDAAYSGAPCPGRVHRLQLDSVEPWQSGNETSSHGLGLGEAVELAHALDRLPRQVIVYAVEIAESGFGVGLSPQIAEIVEPLVVRIEKEILRETRVGSI